MIMASDSILHDNDRSLPRAKEHDLQSTAPRTMREALPSYEEVMAEDEVSIRVDIVVRY